MHVIGHRGASGRLPENTLAAMALACALSDGFECDFQRLRSGSLVVLHDATLWRTATLPAWNPVAALVLRSLPVAWLGESVVETADVGGGEAPPASSKVFALAGREKKFCFAELKAPSTAGELEAIAASAEAAAPADMEATLVWISFSADLMSAMKRRMPGHAAFLVAYAASEEEVLAAADDAAARGLDGVDVPAGAHVSKRVVARCAELGLKVAVWVWRAPAANDTPELWAAAKAAGVWAFTSNLPEEFEGVDASSCAVN